jgi:division/cell wall cluster transcriptional repressor MraZ
MTEPTGATLHKLDMAGRIKLREEERAQLGDRMVMSCNFDKRIALYTLTAFARLKADLGRLPRHDPDVRDLKRFLLSPAETCEVDSQGRVRIPEALLKWAGLGGGVLDAYMMPVDDGEWECCEADRWHEFNSRRDPDLKVKSGVLFAALGAAEQEAEEESA